MIYIIAAYSKNKVIGKDGALPWKIKGELQRFKKVTEGNVVIMGRKTFESLSSPLKNRVNVVVSKTKTFDDENVVSVKSLKEGLTLFEGKDIFISGGQKIFEEGLIYADALLITEIEKNFDGDTFFPYFDETLYEKKVIERFEGEIPYTYLTYLKK